MSVSNLETIARRLVADGKGILAADETVGTLTKRFERLKIPSMPESRRSYRELLFTTPGAAAFISGVIMYDETIRQKASGGLTFPELLLREGIIPGIKVDTGAKPLAYCDGETVTEGLDGLRDRLRDYRALGAQFAKWRAVVRITDRLPSDACVCVNAHALARYAAICQEEGIVPIVEPEVLMEGGHDIDRCSEVTGRMLHAVFHALYEQKVSLEGILLKPNMVISGSACPVQGSVSEVADATIRCLKRHVPAAVPGVVFLSGGQSDVIATKHLNAISRIRGPSAWQISFSYGRALQDPALATWSGNNEKYWVAQQAYYHRAKCNAAATLGRYSTEMEHKYSGETAVGHSSDCEDD
jgi:fructose-bisphosphate aldolase class I